MTDQEILQRLAEIEGYTFEVPRIDDPYWLWVEGEGRIGKSAWAPLKRWSDLGPLIEKYAKTFWIRGPRLWEDSDTWQVGLGITYRESISHKSLPRAICLAIMEAHK